MKVKLNILAMIIKYIQGYIMAVTVLFAATLSLTGQPVPGSDENIPYLMTFGRNGQTSWGDNDFSQTFFFTVPRDHKEPFYIRIFDPEVGGEHDELNGLWNSRMLYSLYGGAQCYTHPDAQTGEPNGNYKSGTLLSSRAFAMDASLDNKWFTFGPINPTEGEFFEKYNSYIFKVVCDGVSGDDGNCYRYFLSKDANSNRPIEGANAFTFQYTFRMWNDTTNIMHIYPFVDTLTTSVQVRTFDWDSDGTAQAISEVRKGQLLKTSGEDAWEEDKIEVLPAEVGKSYDFKFIKRKDQLVRNNNVVVQIRNQRDETLKFYSSPIGGIPVYKAIIGVNKR